VHKHVRLSLSHCNACLTIAINIVSFNFLSFKLMQVHWHTGYTIYEEAMHLRFVKLGQKVDFNTNRVSIVYYFWQFLRLNIDIVLWNRPRLPISQSFPFDRSWSFSQLLPTPWCRILFEKLIVTQLVKQQPAFFYVTRRFITVLTRARHKTLSWAFTVDTVWLNKYQPIRYFVFITYKLPQILLFVEL
jgi:hypothetical protein